MSDVEELIQNLRKTRKMCNKYLAKRVLEIDQRRKSRYREVEAVKESCYQLLLSLFKKEAREQIVKLDAIIRIMDLRLKNVENENDRDEVLQVIESCEEEKNSILNDNHLLKDESNKELVESIIRYLGYDKDSKKLCKKR